MEAITTGYTSFSSREQRREKTKQKDRRECALISSNGECIAVMRSVRAGTEKDDDGDEEEGSFRSLRKP